MLHLGLEITTKRNMIWRLGIKRNIKKCLGLKTPNHVTLRREGG